MFSPSDITVYVPYFNAGKYIPRCIDSLRSQSITPYEIIIIDDGSEEPLPDNLNCRVVKHVHNKGLAAARNTALKSCETKLIASVDADVLAGEYWLEKMLNSLNESDADGVGGKMTEFHQKDLADQWRSAHMAQHWGDARIESPRFLYGANTLFRVKSLKDVGGYNEKFKTNNEDRTISDLMYKVGKTLLYEPFAKCFHLRKDSILSILPAYWGWHHAKGLAEGDFDSVEGLMGRVGRVNFGISNYRFNLDKEKQRNEFLVLDLLIPLVFCCKDIIFYCGRKQEALPDLSLLSKIFSANQSDELLEMLGAYNDAFESNGWIAKYLEIFEQNLTEFMTLEDLKSLDFESWISENVSRVVEKK